MLALQAGNIGFWIVLAVIVVLHVLLVVLIPWGDETYPGYALLPVAALDFGSACGSFKLVEKMSKAHNPTSST